MRANDLPNPNNNVLAVQIIAEDSTPENWRSELVEEPFDPLLHACSVQEFLSFFCSRLGPRLGTEPDFWSRAFRIAGFTYDHIRARGGSVGLLVKVLWVRQLPPPPPRTVVLDPRIQGTLLLDEAAVAEGLKGLSEGEIELLNKERFVGVGKDQTCSICLDDFREGAVVTRLSPCSHEFHNGCIAKWLRRNATCPFCRSRCAV